MKLIHKITKEKEGQYYTVPFSVPENVVKITVSYNYFRPTKGIFSDLKPSNTIDIGLMDEKCNFLGWSGSAHKTISIGEFEASAGYLTQHINSGEWQIIVGAYHVLPDGVDVTNQIPLLIQFVLIVVSLFYISFKPFKRIKRCSWEIFLPSCNAFIMKQQGYWLGS